MPRAGEPFARPFCPRLELLALSDLGCDASRETEHALAGARVYVRRGAPARHPVVHPQLPEQEILIPHGLAARYPSLLKEGPVQP